MEFRTLTAADVECRAAQVRKNQNGAYCDLLIYKDARVDRSILNDTFGNFGWQTEYLVIDGKLFCKLSILNPETHEWISKMEVGTESNTEKEKGQVSDALKRAGFAWGIGEELYSAPRIFINLKDGEYKEYNGKLALTASFKVSQMAVDPKTRKITDLVIVDRYDNPRFSYFGGKENRQSKPTAQVKPRPPHDILQKCAAQALRDNTVEKAKEYLNSRFTMTDEDIQTFYDLCMNNTK